MSFVPSIIVQSSFVSGALITALSETVAGFEATAPVYVAAHPADRSDASASVAVLEAIVHAPRMSEHRLQGAARLRRC